jgi:Uma2 family endonuclease
MIPETTSHPTTVEAFDEWVLLPQNADNNYEFIAGEIRTVVSNNRSSQIASIILGELYTFLKGKNLGSLTTADGGYRIGAERYIPDVAFISKDKLPAPTTEAYVSVAPDLAVEVLSPGNESSEMTIKIVNYMSAGTTVWLVNPELQRVDVFVPNLKPLTLTGADAVIDGAPALPGFSLKLSEIFPPTSADSSTPTAE